MKTKIFKKGDKVLGERAREVEIKEIKKRKIKSIIKKMKKALEQNSEAIAIAGPQIGEPLRIFVIKSKKPVVFINPVIKKISKKKQIVREGCLSIENVHGKIKRAEKLTIEAYGENGERFRINAQGLPAQIIQHEIDHLDGILLIDKAISIENAEK